MVLILLLGPIKFLAFRKCGKDNEVLLSDLKSNDIKLNHCLIWSHKLGSSAYNDGLR